MTRTPRRLGALAALAVLALSGCGTARPGAAAVVGDERISVDELHALTARSLENPDAAQRFNDKAAFQRRELSQLIERRLLRIAAAKLDIDLQPGDVDKRLDEIATANGGIEKLTSDAAASGVAKTDLRAAVEDLVLGELIADELTADKSVPDDQLKAAYQANIDSYDQVRSAHILVSGEKRARELLAQVKADPSSFAKLASQFSIDPGSKDNGGELGFSGRGKLVKPYADAIFTGKAGDITLVKSEFGWHVIKVEERRTITLAQATPELRRNILGEARNTALRDYLSEIAKDEGISVSPRFGKWDAKTAAVVPREGELSTPEGGSPTPEATPTDPGAGG